VEAQVAALLESPSLVNQSLHAEKIQAICLFQLIAQRLELLLVATDG
jgi:hypothetical protein